MSQTVAGLRSCSSPDLVQTVIVSYGDGHHDAPRGDALRIDTRPLRNPPSDPAVRERMLHSTGLDPHVRAPPGFETIVQRGLDHALALLAVPGRRHRVDIHVACGGAATGPSSSPRSLLRASRPPTSCTLRPAARCAAPVRPAPGAASPDPGGTRVLLVQQGRPHRAAAARLSRHCSSCCTRSRRAAARREHACAAPSKYTSTSELSSWRATVYAAFSASKAASTGRVTSLPTPVAVEVVGEAEVVATLALRLGHAQVGLAGHLEPPLPLVRAQSVHDDREERGDPLPGRGPAVGVRAKAVTQPG